METVTIPCSACQQMIAIAASDLGYHVRCPLCQQVILAARSEPPAATAPPEDAAPVPLPTDAPPSEPEVRPQEVISAATGDTATDKTPPASAPVHDDLLSPFETDLDTGQADEAESIFGKENPSDDIFDSGPTLTVEMPQENESAAPEPAAPEPTPPQPVAPQLSVEQSAEAPVTEVPVSSFAPPNHGSVTPVVSDDVGVQAIYETPAEPAPSDAPWFDDSSAAAAGDATATPTLSVAGSEVVRRTRAGGMVSIILLIFFIPYSIFATGVVTWLILTRQTYDMDPLERMLEENKGKSRGIKRIKHDTKVSDKLRTTLGTAFAIGAVEIKPLKVVLTQKGNLELYATVRNISTDLQFNPLPAVFAEYDHRFPRSAKPYIFLEEDQKDGSQSRKAYGGIVHWLKKKNGKLERVLSADADLLPNEEMTVKLITFPEDQKLVQAFVKNNRPLLWRVHLRRGLEEIAGKDRSITCVVGVEFRGAGVEKS